MKRNERALAILPDYLKNLKIVKNPIEEVLINITCICSHYLHRPLIMRSF